MRLVIRPTIQMLEKSPVLQDSRWSRVGEAPYDHPPGSLDCDTQSTQSPCMTHGPQPCAGTQPTAATQRPPWMAHLGNVSTTFLSLALESLPWEALSDIRTKTSIY